MRVREIELAGERVTLWPERALGWPAARTLFVADVHLGKPASFAAAGIPVPCGTTERDLERLSACVEASGSGRLVILGDLLHARSGCVDEVLGAVERWRARWAGLEVVLVRGNHDRRAGDPPGAWGFSCVEEGVVEGPFVLAHEPREDERGYVLCGHVHPAVTLTGGGWRERRAAFVLGPRVGVLPAFGSFTGSARVEVPRGGRVFVVGPGEVVEAPVGMGVGLGLGVGRGRAGRGAGRAR